MKTKYYDIHGIIKVACNIEHFPKHFEVERIDEKDLDIIIEMGEFEFDKTGSERVGLRYHIGGGKLYLDYKIYGLVVKKLLIKNLFGRAEFKFTKRTKKIFNISHFINLLLEIKLLQKGCTFVHAGAVSKKGNGYLIASWSDIEKSSTVFNLADKSSFDVLGVDNVILSDDGTIYCWPKKRYVVAHSRGACKSKLSISQKIKLRFKHIAANIRPLYLYISPSISIDLSDMKKITDKSQLSGVYFLERGNGKEDLDKAVGVKKLMALKIGDHSRYFAEDTFIAYCYENGFNPTFIEEKKREILNKVLRRCTVIKNKKKEFYKQIETMG